MMDREMSVPTPILQSAADVRERLQSLLAERALAGVEGLAGNSLYMTDLEQDIEATRAAYVGVAVTDIAVLRGLLSGRLQG